MTREEAIKILKSIRVYECYPKSASEETKDAIDMAIEALSAEPKTETVLCALADRACPFQGKEYAWCLTCPHISEEDRALVKKAVAEPKTGRWMDREVIDDRKDAKIPQWQSARCDQCGKYHTTPYMYYFDDYNFCPNCGSFNGGADK